MGSLSQGTNRDLWSHIDAIVLQWIYGTISNDLLNTIMEQDTIVAIAWTRLRDIFYDNKNSQILYLEQEFSIVHMENFFDASSYCRQLKSLNDQLSNVDAPISNERLVLQLVEGLTDAYTNVDTQIYHGDTLPLFYKARSMLVLEETSHAKRPDISPEPAAFVASSSAHSGDISQHGQSQFSNSRGSGRSGGRGCRVGHTGSCRRYTSHNQI